MTPDSAQDISIIKSEARATQYGIAMLEIDMMDLDPFEFRLLAELRRRAGLGPLTPIALDNLAAACQMNRRTVKDARDRLIAKGRIALEANGARKPSVITLIDTMPENVRRAGGVLDRRADLHETAAGAGVDLRKAVDRRADLHDSRGRDSRDLDPGIPESLVTPFRIPSESSTLNRGDSDWPAAPFDGWINKPAPEYSAPYLAAAVPLSFAFDVTPAKAAPKPATRAAKGLFKCGCGIEYAGTKTGARGAGWLIEDDRALCPVCRAALPKVETLREARIRVFAATYYGVKDFQKEFGAVKWSTLQIIHGDKRNGRCDGLIAYEGDDYPIDELERDLRLFKGSMTGITPPRDCAKFMTAWHDWRQKHPRRPVDVAPALPTPTEDAPLMPDDVFERQMARLRARNEGR